MGTALSPPRATGLADLVVERRDIRFFNLTYSTVRIDVTVHNRGDAPSRPMPMRIECAPFGAFVQWSPLTTLTVPPIAPGTSTVVATEVEREPAGSYFDPPAAPLVATSAGDADRRRDAVPPRRSRLASQAMGQVLLQRLSPPGVIGKLPPDLHELLGRRSVHWMGNLNVHVDGKAVERHVARNLRVHAGLLNFAMFVVGNGRDSYSFEVRGDADWDVWLLKLPHAEPVADSGVGARRWIDIESPIAVHAYMHPGEAARVTSLDIAVLQRSSGREALVEFTLDPSAAGPGCYTL